MSNYKSNQKKFTDYKLRTRHVRGALHASSRLVFPVLLGHRCLCYCHFVAGEAEQSDVLRVRTLVRGARGSQTQSGRL